MPFSSRLAFVALLASAPALAAAQCEDLVGAAEESTGAAAAPAWGALIECDRALAEKQFSTFLRAAGDVDSVVALAKVGIAANLYAPVWTMLEEVADYSSRDAIAREIGQQCDQDGILPFLQGAYGALRDRPFATWREAFIACPSDGFDSWLADTASKPPSSPFDDKYNTVVEALVKRQRGEALPTLETAAVAAAGSAGPFSTLVDAMHKAVKPESISAELPAEALSALTASYTRVAHAVPAEQAGLIADRLFQIGAERAAASLLPSVYPDRVQPDGSLLYGVASVESCGGEAVVHWAPLTEPASRWSIVADAEGPARAFKPRLKCQTEEAWPVMTTPSPVKSVEEVATWGEEVAQKWAAGGVETKTREEKPIAL